ncbi:precorrin-6A reductase [Candidatus Formimonas warabiya]|uniref:Precorrin-6x reductase n=1 Tax=Formimonas warabiya TaxID=1761012 RepID=A0A3G1L0G0_FORW1|nr:precorrin-6A reductase [Candidatus Formimonas warabiya]ATW28131.1 precorrin-6x reductase [Candidatus Formimonas warabiya]
MILVIGGTGDALDIACTLSELTENVTISTATEYGFEVSRDRFPGRIIFGKMDREDLKKYLQKEGITHVVDASHPYAENISRHAILVCQELGIDYVRFERPAWHQEGGAVLVCASYAHAADRAEQMTGNIFISTGINHVEEFVTRISDKKRLKIRVLPQSETILKLENLGLHADHIIAMKGPFSEEMNYLMFKEAGAAILICKDSGVQGGTDHKLTAAKHLGMTSIIIKRPDLAYPNQFEQITDLKRYFKELIE